MPRRGCPLSRQVSTGRHQPAASIFILSWQLQSLFSSRSHSFLCFQSTDSKYSWPGAKHLTKESQSALAILRSCSDWFRGSHATWISTENAGTRWFHWLQDLSAGKEKARGGPGAAHWAWAEAPEGLFFLLQYPLWWTPLCSRTPLVSCFHFSFLSFSCFLFFPPLLSFLLSSSLFFLSFSPPFLPLTLTDRLLYTRNYPTFKYIIPFLQQSY